MSFTIVLAFLALLALAVVFGITYKVKGWKVAAIITGIAMVIFSVLYVMVITAIVNSM